MASLQTLEIEQARLRERHEENPEGRLFAPLADVLRKLGRLDEALQLCRHGLERHPAYSSAYVILGKIHLERGESDDAAEAFEKVLELDPENLLALRHLAKMREAEGALDQAEGLWQRVAHLEPDSDAVEERLEALRRRRERMQEQSPDESQDQDQDQGRAEAPKTPARAGADPSPEGADAPEESGPSDTPASASVSSAEIATITLAQIYYEQGFLRKAVEVYEQVRERNPQLEGIDEQIARLHREIEEEQRAPQPAEAELDELVVEAESPVSASVGSGEEELIREGPITRKGEGRTEKERFDGFRRWLDGIADDEDADSE